MTKDEMLRLIENKNISDDEVRASMDLYTDEFITRLDALQGKPDFGMLVENEIREHEEVRQSIFKRRPKIMFGFFKEVVKSHRDCCLGGNTGGLSNWRIWLMWTLIQWSWRINRAIVKIKQIIAKFVPK